MGTASTIQSGEDRSTAVVFRSQTDGRFVFVAINEAGSLDDEPNATSSSTLLSPAEARELAVALIERAREVDQAIAEDVAWGERHGMLFGPAAGAR